jgi:hypothetical protein
MENHILTLAIDRNSTKEIKLAVDLLSHFAVVISGAHSSATILALSL